MKKSSHYLRLLAIGAFAVSIASNPGNALFPTAHNMQVVEASSQDPSTEVKANVAIKDTELLKALAILYNTESGESKTEDTLTLADLKTLTTVDLSSLKSSGDVDVSKITTLDLLQNSSTTGIKGIGSFLPNVTDLDLSGTGIRSISSEAFKDHAALTNVTLPDELTNLGRFCFDGCTKLEHFNSKTADGHLAEDTLPTSLSDKASSLDGTDMGAYAFKDCTALTKVIVPALTNKSGIQNATSMFSGCTGITEVQFSNSISVIPDEFLSGAGNTTSGFTFSFVESTGTYGLETINTSAFRNSTVNAIDLSKCESLSYIKETAFQGCKKMNEFIFPRKCGALIVGDHALYGDSNLQNKLLAPETTTADQKKIIESVTASPTALQSIVLPETCDSLTLGVAAFACNYNLADVYPYGTTNAAGVIMPSYMTIKDFGSCMFAINNAITTASYNLSVIPENTFYKCGALEDITFSKPDTLTDILQLAFFDTALTSISIPSTVTNIERNAFAGCDFLETIIWNTPADADTATLELGEGAFRSCVSLTTILDKVTTNTKNTLPATIRKIGSYAFDGCINLENIYLSNNVEGAAPEMGISVFGNCYSLTDAGLPASLEAIPEKCFVNDICLQTLPLFYSYDNTVNHIVLADNTQLTTIGKNSFQYCYALSLDKNHPIYDTVTTIDASAFFGDCNLGELKFGENLVSIGNAAFADTACYYTYDVKQQNDASFLFTAKRAEGNADKISASNIDFRDAIHLTSIANNAFIRSPLEVVDLTGTQVTKLQTGSFSACPYLKEVTLNPEMQYVSINSLSGNPSLTKFEVLSTTTVDTQAFYQGETTNSKSGTVYTPLPNLTFTVNPAAVEVSAGNTINFPFYVIPNKKDVDNFIGDLIIGTENSPNDELYKHVSVTAYLGKQNNYYCNKTATGSAIEEGDYFTRLSAASVAKINGTNVNVFQIKGLETSQNVLDGQDKIPFTVRINYSAYTNANKEKINKTIPTQYYVEVTNSTPTYVNLTKHDLEITKDLKATKDRTSFTVAGDYKADKVYRMNSASGTISYTYSVDDLYNPEIKHDTKDIVIETSDPEIICLDTKNPTVTSLDVNTGTISMAVKKAGNATVKIYPKEMEGIKDAIALVINYTVVSDVKAIDLAVPAEYAATVEEGSSFPILSKITFANNEVLQKDAETGLLDLTAFPSKTDATITFESSNPELATIDKDGIVTIKKVADQTDVVTFTATATNNNEKNPTITKKLDYKIIKYTAITPVLYSDSARATEVSGDQTLHMNSSNPSGKVSYYFNYKKSLAESDYVPGTCNLIVETSDPEVVSPEARGTQQLKEDNVPTNKWLVSCAAKTDKVNSLDLMTAGKLFTLTPKKCGTATIKVYSEMDPKSFVEFNVTVVSDIKDFTLSIPDERKSSQNPGDTFVLLDSVTNYNNTKLTRADKNLNQLATITDNKIIFTSSDPKVASIDANGLVKVNVVTFDETVVTFTATVNLSNDKKIEKTMKYSIKYPALSTGSALNAPGGDTIKVVTMGSKAGDPNIATYTGAPAGATTVNVPAAITISGKTFKITSIAENAFANNAKLKSVTIANGITTISKGAFSNCSALQSVTLPASVTTIEESAFAKCISLTKITIPNNTTAIGTKAFYGCKKLKTVTISSKSKLTTIGASAFENCSALTKILLPKKLTEIGTKAFYKCKKLKTVTTKATGLTTIGKKAFKSISSKAVVKVPSKKLATYKPMFKKAGVSGKKQKIKK